MEKVDKDKLREPEYSRLGTVFNSIFGAMSTLDYNFNANEIDEMLLDSDIKSSIDTIKRAVNSKVINIKTTANESIRDNLLKQFDDINLNNVIDVIIDSKYKGYSVQELLYNEDLTMQGLKEKPNSWYILQWNDTKKEYEWVLSYGAGTAGINVGKELPFAKYLIPINRPTDIFITGRSELEPLYKWWKIKNNALEYANTIVEKYGGVITWFLYDINSTEAQLQTMVDNISGLTNGSQIPIPEKPGGQAQGLNHEFGFITMNDLKIDDIHISLVKFCKDQISQYLIGSSINMTAGQSGSYSSGEIGAELLKSTVDSYTEYVEYWLEWLVYYQATIFGYNYKDYKLELIDKPDENERQDLNKKRIDNYIGLKNIGYQVSAEYISKETGIPIEDLTEIQVQAFNTLEFQKKKTIDDLTQEDKRIDEELQKILDIISGKVTGQIAEQYKEQFSKINTKADIDNVKTNWAKTDFDEWMLIFELFGRYTQTYRDTLEFEEELTVEEIFKLPFEDAIKFFTNKMPMLFDDIGELTEEAIAKTFWVKKITDIESIQKMKTALEKVIEQGGTFKSFTADIDDVLAKTGIAKDGYYLDNVFRTNVMSSYGAGRYNRQKETTEEYPYWLYNAIEDDRTSEICSRLDGKVYRSDNPIWNQIYPINHYRCFDKETEVLTYDGWVLFKNITGGEKFASINPVTKELEYVNANNKIEYHHNGKMINFKTYSFDMMVTPDHQIPYIDRHHANYNNDYTLRFRDADSMAVSNQIPRVCEFIGENFCEYFLGDMVFDTGDFMEFMGWYLGDGSITLKNEKTNYWTIKITQIKDKLKKQHIYDLSKRVFGKFFNMCDGKEGTLIYGNNKDVYDYFKKLGYCNEKYIPRDLMNLDKKYLRRLLDGMVATDGSCYKSSKKNNLNKENKKQYTFKGYKVYISSSKQLVEDIGELIIKCGKLPSYSIVKSKGKSITFKNGTYITNFDIYNVLELNSEYYSHRKKYVKEIEYNDMVYCVELERNHTLYVRRNGKCTWSGNCRSVVTPLSDEQLQEYGLKLAEVDTEAMKSLEEIQKIGFNNNPGNQLQTLKRLAIKKQDEVVESNTFSGIKDEKIKNKYIEAFEKSPQEIKNIVLKYSNELNVDVNRGGESYSNGMKLIKLNNDSKNTTYLHEFGHFIDNVVKIGNKIDDVTLKFNTISYDEYGTFDESKKSKLQTEISTVMKSFLRAKGKIKRESIKKELFEDIGRANLVKDNYGAVQDIFNGLTRGKISFFYGHDNQYWKRTESPYRETFANMFELYSNSEKTEAKEQINFIKKHIPKVWQEFEEFIKKEGDVK